jgi:flagellar hook protein FlgE
MLRSLYSGISGLHAHQQMMDVTGNNIANVNTVGYKSSTVQFQDTLSQMLGAAGAPQNGQGGFNPSQVGLGVRNAGIITNFAQGSQETTGRSGDMMIQGDGFFITRNGSENLYTRAGSFSFDANGTLVSASGQPVQGWTGVDGVVNTSAKPDDIRMPLGSTIAPKETTSITLKGNLSTDTNPDPNVVAPIPYVTTIPVKVYDETGATKTVVAQFTRTTNDATASPPTSEWTVHLPYDPNDNTVGEDQTLTFKDGKPVDSAGVAVTTMPFTGSNYTVDVKDLTSYAGLSDARVFDTDGQAAGALTSLSYSVSNNGQLIGVYSNGLKEVLGQVAMATFKNAAGLEKVGDSAYRSTVNSGYAQVGQPASAGMGSVVSGALEMSNVDLAQEFTNLVIAQRGFQANSRVITTSDELLQELVSMKR